MKLLQTHVWRFLPPPHSNTLHPGGVQEEADDPIPAWQYLAKPGEQPKALLGLIYLVEVQLKLFQYRKGILT